MYTNRGFLRRQQQSEPSLFQGRRNIEINTEINPFKEQNFQFSKSYNQSVISPPTRFLPQITSFSPNNKKPVLNQYKINAIFDVFSNHGYGGFRKYAGVGFLITPEIGITTHMILPNQNVANNTVLSFPDSSNQYKLTPDNFFYTNEQLNFTIFSVENEVLIERRNPIGLNKEFSLKTGDQAVYYTRVVESKLVKIVEEKFFCYAGNDVPAGMPIYNIFWELQGIHTSETPYYRINEATRIDAIFSVLESAKHLLNNQDLVFMIEKAKTNPVFARPQEKPEMPQYVSSTRISSPVAQVTSSPNESFVSRSPVVSNQITRRSYGGVNLYWFEWFSRTIYICNEREQWNSMIPANSQELDEYEIWYFPWNCRYCFISPINIFIGGGLSDDKGTVSNEAFLYKTRENTLHRIPYMKIPREAPALVCIGMKVFVLGGRNSRGECECLNLERYVWTSIAPMFEDRFDHSAGRLKGNIFVFGGIENEIPISTVEKYDTESNIWSMIVLNLDEPLLHVGIGHVSEEKLIIFGGSYSSKVFSLSDEEGEPVWIDMKVEIGIETLFPMVSDGVNLIGLSGEEGYMRLKIVRVPIEDLNTTRKVSVEEVEIDEPSRFPPIGGKNLKSLTKSVKNLFG